MNVPIRDPYAEVKAKVRWMLDHLGYIDINMLDSLDPVHASKSDYQFDVEREADEQGITVRRLTGTNL